MIILISAFSFIVVFAYIYLITGYYKGWKKNKVGIQPEKVALLSVSVVVCCKNEEKRLPGLIRALRNQEFKQFELIWVNDHSTDASAEMLEASVHLFQDGKILHASGRGKKSAQKEGILASKGSLIITTDADCIPVSTWISSIVNFYQTTKAAMIIAPVRFSDQKSIFGKLQQLEFMSLVASGMGAALSGKPVFCNAANMAFEKSAWLSCLDELHEDEISGDDVFLLHALKRRNARIEVLQSKAAMVETSPQPDLKSFIRQRRRWLSKTSSYTDRDILLTGAVVGSINILLLCLFFFSFMIPVYSLITAFVFIAKLSADYFFLKMVSGFFEVKTGIKNILLMSFIYPFYVLVSGLSAVMNKSNKW